MKVHHINNFFKEVKNIAEKINKKDIQRLAETIYNIKKKRGRLFFLGVGGSAANCSHAVNDFRKLCNVEAYSPTDNVSEITARTNDEGFNTIFSEYLKVSNLNAKDTLLIFSVGGGNLKKKVSIKSSLPDLITLFIISRNTDLDV